MKYEKFGKMTCNTRSLGRLREIQEVWEDDMQYKKFWEELIAYLPLIRHGPHTKRRV
jgi:hypothetical protein